MNPPSPRYLLANVRNPDGTGVTALVAFGLVTDDAEFIYLVIRYIDYTQPRVEGDHVYFSLEEVIAAAQDEYGIEPQDWRPLSEAEIRAIDARIGPGISDTQ
ncbi:hypothetical protein [Pseudomonas maioricensis]|uniref:hypothetical protein n=1 Tax=Pseudomonas maioricensis TaxID=1766623 RepID=UPI001FAD531A|nr:hypothetical protein [Pseudomonas sp. S25]